MYIGTIFTSTEQALCFSSLPEIEKKQGRMCADGFRDGGRVTNGLNGNKIVQWKAYDSECLEKVHAEKIQL